MAEKYIIDHDLHIHSSLSSCCKEAEMTPSRIAETAIELGHKEICLTDHFWDSNVYGASNWYKVQDYKHVTKAFPLPKKDGLKVFFGCETEYCGGTKLGITPKTADRFDFIIIPPNHFHMHNFVRPYAPQCPYSEEAMAEFFTARLEELAALDIPLDWRKVGIAHLTCSLMYKEGNCFDVVEKMNEDRLKAVFDVFAKREMGIELNYSAIGVLDERADARLKLYRIAKECGCKFYCASDAHAFKSLHKMRDILLPAVDALGLTENDKYIIPRR